MDKIKETDNKVTVGNTEFSENLNNFLNDITENQNEIISILESQENQELKNRLENFLQSQNPEDKNNVNLLKFKLATCEPDDIAGIIAEHVGYKIGNTDVGVRRDVSNNGISINSMNQAVQNEAEAVQNEAEAVQNEAEAVQNEAEAVQNEAEAVQNKAEKMVNREYEDMQNLREDAMYARITLLASHPDQKKAEEIDKKTREKAELAQQQLPEETKNQLKEKGYDENFINDYILLRVTANEVKNDSNFDRNAVAQFESKVNELSSLDIILKNIDNACNIPDTSLSSFSSENITQTRHELFNSDIGNDNLINLKASNIKMRKRKNADGKSDYDRMFPEMTEEEMVQTYGKFLVRGAQPYLEEYNKCMNGPQTEKEKYMKTKNYKDLIDTIKNIKTAIDDKTKDLMEELCIISQIKGMYMCMGEGDNFDLNKANEIESKDGILTLNGHIDGVDFAIRQDTNNPEAKLQTSQKLVRSSDRNTFTIGGKNNFVDSNFILPSQNEVFNLAVESVNSNGALDDADTPARYVELMQKRFMNKVDNMYEDTKYVHHYMKEQVKGEKIVDNAVGFMEHANPNHEDNWFKNINTGRSKDLYPFIKVLDFNIKNSTDYEKDKLNGCITKIREITDNYKNSNGTEGPDAFKYPPIIEKFLKNETWLDSGDQNSRIGLVGDLFSYYSKNSIDLRSGREGNDGEPSKMIINDLYRDLFESSNSESLVSKKRTEEQTQQEADSKIDLALQDEEKFPPSPDVEHLNTNMA